MLLLVLAYVGGILTIVSPCTLPVLPFVFSRADQPFRKSGLPLLAGMAVAFAAIASLAAVGGGWIVRANQYGRVAALVLFAFFGLALISSTVSGYLARPLVRLGDRLTRKRSGSDGILSSIVLGIGTGLLWAPCAGPILGLILTGAAISGPSARTGILLLAYSAGAATSLAVVLLAGGKLFAALKRSLGADQWVRRLLGAAILIGVAVISLGLDRGFLTRVSTANTTGLEQALLNHLDPAGGSQAPSPDPPPERPQVDQTLVVGPSGNPFEAFQMAGATPQLAGATAWINSPPLTVAGLRGKVVLIDFWTYSCINCLRTLPYVKAWYQKYKDSGLVVIGVHTPEFPFEKNEGNVRAAVHRLGIHYPVAMDNNYAIWRSFQNSYWPADYFVDAYGRVRFHHFGEGGYAESEGWIRKLLTEANRHVVLPAATIDIAGKGVEEAPDMSEIQSPETYIGHERASGFASPGGLKSGRAHEYTAPEGLGLNRWALVGKWKDEGQTATLLSPTGSILFRFHARDLNLVLAPGKDGKPIRFRITIDGAAPGQDHGVDTNEQGYGAVTEDRLYQMVRQHGSVGTHTFRIDFLDTGVRAYSFTFG